MSGVIAAEMIRRLSDSLVLPFNLVTYAYEVEKEYNSFEKTHLDLLKNELNITLEYFKEAVQNLILAAKEFHKRLNETDKTK